MIYENRKNQVHERREYTYIDVIYVCRLRVSVPRSGIPDASTEGDVPALEDAGGTGDCGGCWLLNVLEPGRRGLVWAGWELGWSGVWPVGGRTGAEAGREKLLELL